MRLELSFVSAAEVVESSRKWLAIPGLGCIVAGVVGGGLKLGDVELPAISTTSRQVGVAAIGVVLIIMSFIRLHGPEVAGTGIDVAFWEKVFEAMPPAFVKEFPSDSHARDNQALRTLQGHKPREPIGDSDFLALINADHRAGDVIAANSGASVQLEYSDQFTTRYPQLILTFKTRIEHAGKVYIAGWYLPVEHPPEELEPGLLDVKKSGEQVLFSITPTTEENNPFVINVGRAVRFRRRQGPRPSAERDPGTVEAG